MDTRFFSEPIRATACALAAALLLFVTTSQSVHAQNAAPGAVTPSPAQVFPFQDPSLPVDKRVDDLISRMTLAEKAAQMDNGAPAIPRLGLPSYQWWSECLHGDTRFPDTVFPEPIGLGATWDLNLERDVAKAISDEDRGWANGNIAAGRPPQRLTFFAPNINIFRDPRWGRGQETYGEDPFLTGEFGVVYINELQGTDPNHLKVVATPKHFAVHSAPEATRSHFEAYTTDYDLFDTYLPAFQAAVERAHAQSIMGAYSGINGVPDNANHRLLGDILRKQWGFDGYVVSDCGAITNLFTQHHYAKSLAAAAADGVNAGCDLACDGAYVNLPEAVKEGLTTEKQIDVSLKRLFTERFKLGMFDPPTSDPYSNIPSSVIDSPEHRALAVKSAEESIVLLKNDNNTLPFGKSVHTIAVIGPNADAGDTLLGNYHGRPSSIATILQGITKRAGADVKVVYAQGCSIGVTSYTSKPIDPALLSFNGQAGLHGEYFLGNGFSGKPVLVRQDPTVQFEWSKTPPDTSIPHDNYCVRWTGMLTVPNTGTYRLEVTADDGSRLYINGKRVIDDWTTHPAQTRNAMVTLQGGQPTPIKLEYFQGTGQASVALNLAVPVAPDDSGYAEALAAAQNADAVVFVGGINGSFEGEGHDRTAIDLPDTQEQLLEKLGALGKPLTLVLVNGSMIAVNWAKDHATAIVEAWYPGEEGGTAVANVLFGDYNPAGRLPVTFYTGLNQVPDLEDYHMLHRTYRYFTDTPLFPFGYGLSYTTFSYGNLTCPPRVEANNGLTVSAQVANTGSVTGDEVVEAYLRPLPNKPDAHRMIDRTQPMPRLLLAGFQRVTNLAPGASQTVTVNIPASQLLLVNSKGQRRLQPGSWRVYIAGHQPDPTQTAEPGVLSSDVTVK